jgi:hypothetical protein
MATVYKNAQLQGTSSTSTYGTLYSTDGSTTAVISTIAICNTAGSTGTYRIAIMDSEGTPAAENWIVYDGSVAGNDTIVLTLGITLGNSQYLRVSSSADTLTFSAYLSEIS